jgi:ribosomal protein S18 acetylase RimI-like enzyme
VKIKIRPVKKTDKAALALVYQACFSPPPFSEKWSLASAQKRIAQLLAQPDTFGWVVSVFNQPVGFAFLQAREGFSGAYGELMESAIHPYFRKQGIGTLLFKAVRKIQRKKRLRVVYTVAYRGMFEDFYRKTGFKPSKHSMVYVWK